MRREKDETVTLVSIQRQTIALQDEALQTWRDAIDVFYWAEAIKQAEASRKESADKYAALLAKWNAIVPEYNEVVAPKRRNFGRPLLASPTQRDDVLKRHDAGQSLRSIAEDMTLGFQTVRTIVDKKDWVDRATIARLERIAPDRIASAKQRALQRKLQGIPRSLKRLLTDTDRLIAEAADLNKRAKGLK